MSTQHMPVLYTSMYSRIYISFRNYVGGPANGNTTPILFWKGGLFSGVRFHEFTGVFIPWQIFRSEKSEINVDQQPALNSR